MYNFVNCLQFNIWYEKVEHPAPVGGALVFKVYVGWSYCSVGKKFLQYLVSLIGFARMDFSEQYLLEGEAQDVRNDENPIVRICQSGVGDISIMSC